MIAVAVAILALFAVVPGHAAAAPNDAERVTCPELRDAGLEEEVTLDDWKQCQAEQFEREQKDLFRGHIEQARGISSWLDNQGRNLQESRWSGIRTIGDVFRDFADSIDSFLDKQLERTRY